MRGEEDFAALGLRPGATRAQVDEAYRRLIKRFHPDRTGGDGGRAAEINRAYTQLTRRLPAPAAPRRNVPVAVAPQARRSGARSVWIAIGLLGAAGLAGAAIEYPRFGSGRPVYSTPLSWTDRARQAAPGSVSPLTDFDEPLNELVIDRSIADAVNFYEAGDTAGTLAFSRSCHNSLRSTPSLTWFDTCAAFDEATAILNSDNALAESGPFSTSAVIARHMASARVMARDMLDADSRVHDIRSRVEFNLIPRLDEAAAAVPAKS